ncbi:hypothetical protein [Dongia rigui]|uniref:Uncharacterized protein n=1 Tax=Dongia rigui TaxID=940149 RepID=A0ABU5DZU7_9PROT|nr:hypothetical protein [Dongia rigui]MDY0872831.1 hypothetical protein [Dongia rigui]
MKTLSDVYQCASTVAVARFVVDIFDPLPHGYPVNVPGVICTVSPENPDRARLSIDRGDLRLHIEFWSEGWAPMRPATPTLIEMAEDEAAGKLGAFSMDQLESDEFKQLAQQLTERNILWYGKGAAWNPLPEGSWLDIEFWFERLAGAR